MLPLLVLGALSIASNVLLSAQLGASREDAALVNLAGRQRMLSQRIAWDAAALSTSAPAGTARLRNDLRSSLNQFVQSHERLKDPASGLYRSRDAREVDRLYAGELNTQVEAFVAAAQRVLSAPPATLRGGADLTLLQTQARGGLLVSLEKAVKRAERRSEGYMARLNTLAWLRVAVVLGLLALVGGVIVRPLERRNRSLLSGLARERDFARTIVQSMGQGLAVTGRDGRVTHINPALARMLGEGAERVLGQGLPDLTGPDAAQEPPVEGRTALRRADGSTLPVQISTAPLGPQAEEGRVTVITDLSAHEQTERELRGREARYAALAANFPNGAVVLFDRDLRYLIAGGEGLADVGLSRETVEGRRPDEIFSPEVHAVVVPDHLAALAGQRSERELTFFGRSYAVQTFPVPDEEGAGGVQFGIVIVRDVTEQVQARQEIEMQSAELAVLAQTADQARRDALTLAELTRRLGQAQTMEDLTAQTFAVLGPALEVGWLALIQLQHARSHLLGLHGPVPGEVRARLTAGDGLRARTLWRAVQQGPQYLEQTDQPLLAAQGVTGVALVPLPRKPQRGDVLLIAAREGLVLSWTARQRILLEAAAEALCAAWERVALLEDLRRAAEYARALVDISQLIETDDAVETVAARAGTIVARASGVDWLALVVAEGDHARVLTSHSGPRVSRAFTARVTEGVVRGEGILWQVLDRHEALYIDDYAAAPGANDSLIQHGVRAAAWVPLSRVGPQSLLLSAMRMERQPWHDHDRALFEAAARSVNVALERQAHLRELETAALTDALTALGNRRAFETELREAVAAARRDGTPLTVVMIDLDGLKHFNDTYGHDRGDTLLRAFAQALRQSFRTADRAYRLGGDEYALLLGSAGTPEDFLRRVQQAVTLTRASGFETAGASAGVASFPVDGASAPALAKRADERLYAAKQARPGRGRPR